MTCTSCESVRWHESVPAHAPPQLSKRYPSSAVATSCTFCPEAKLAWHVRPQSIPSGLDRTLPWPLSITATVRLTVCVSPEAPLPLPQLEKSTATTPNNAIQPRSIGIRGRPLEQTCECAAAPATC